MDDFDVILIVDLGGGKDAVLACDLEERHRDHEGAGELKSVVLGEGEIVCHG